MTAAALCASAFLSAPVSAETEKYDGQLKFKDGTILPMCEFSDPRDPKYSNKNSDILRYCVYVETDNDTDNDGLADLVKVVVQVPRSAAEGKYQAAAIYDPTPYNSGTYEPAVTEPEKLFTKKSFDYNELYRPCEKRRPKGSTNTIDCAMKANAKNDWNYKVPISGKTGYAYLQDYDYYLVRGFAVVECSGIGTYGSEGFELCSTYLERDSHKAVVEWLTGDRKAYTDKTHNIEIKADWSNGKVAMTGCSYGGTLPFEVATTGVKGLETIIPFAGIASWYDYTNSQGVSTIFDVNYANYLAAVNCGGTFLDDEWKKPNKEYGKWLWQIAKDQEATNGRYAEIWQDSDYTNDWKNIKCSALIVQGLNDFNVSTKQADLMAQCFEKAGKNYKLVLHQDGHNNLDDTMVNGELWQEIMLKWLAHYLYGVDNGSEKMPEVLAQSNIDGNWKTYKTWRDFKYKTVKVSSKTKQTVVDSTYMGDAVYQYIGDPDEELDNDYRDAFYTWLPEELAAKYTVKLNSGTTVYGVPEVKVRLSTEVEDFEGLMITAVLVDVANNGSEFDAYNTKTEWGNTLPETAVDIFDAGGNLGERYILEYDQTKTKSKVISYGWTDLTIPGKGYDSSEYTTTVDIKAGKFYDYTFYMLPTVYTLRPGHHLELILTTWDPYMAFLDERYLFDMDKDSEEIDYEYSYTIDNNSIRVRIPTAKAS